MNGTVPHHPPFGPAVHEGLISLRPCPHSLPVSDSSHPSGPEMASHVVLVGIALVTGEVELLSVGLLP